ncbi:MAG: hypothetical protein AAF802_29680 [Planctomycetota bacterium]
MRTHVPSKDAAWRRFAKRMVGSRGLWNLRLARFKPNANHAIVKDPVGWYFAKYLHDEFEAEIVIIVKHPISLFASYRRLDWHHTFHRVLRQPHVMNLLPPDIASRLSCSHDFVDAIALHWLVIYTSLRNMLGEHSRVTVRTIESLSNDPLNQYQSFCETLSIPWTKGRERLVQRRCLSGGAAEAKKTRLQDLTRRSAEIFEHRVRSVSAEDRKRIHQLTWPIAKEYYNEDSFRLE